MECIAKAVHSVYQTLMFCFVCLNHLCQKATKYAVKSEFEE